MELRPGGFQQDKAFQARHEVFLALLALAVDGQDRGPHLGVVAHPGVVVLLAVDADPVPAVLVDLDPTTLDGLDVVDEVPTEREGIVLDLADALLLGVGVAGLLLGVGRQHPGLVAGQVGAGEVAAERRGDVDVADLVAFGVAVDAHDAVLRLAVLVGSEHDAHDHFPFLEVRS